MDAERRRITRMLEEGKISPEECEALLDALPERPDRGSVGRASRWPVILIILCTISAPVSVLVIVPAFARNLDGFTGFTVLALISFAFSIGMLVDAFLRPAETFKTVFTQSRPTDRRLWLAVIVCSFPIGAVLYSILISIPARLAASRRSAAPDVAVMDTNPTPSRAQADPSTRWVVAVCMFLYVLIGVALTA